jgi:hypothetical protein
MYASDEHKIFFYAIALLPAVGVHGKSPDKKKMKIKYMTRDTETLLVRDGC